MSKHEDDSIRFVVESAAKARNDWLDARGKAFKLASELFQPGRGYGDPDARKDDEQRLLSARYQADRLFTEYTGLEHQIVEINMLKLQRSQKWATWASFAVAFTVALATIISLVLPFILTQ